MNYNALTRSPQQHGKGNKNTAALNSHKKGGEIMSVVSNHVNGRLRITAPERKTVKSFHRIRPTISSGEATSLLVAVDMISQQTVVGAFLTVTTELAEAE